MRLSRSPLALTQHAMEELRRGKWTLLILILVAVLLICTSFLLFGYNNTWRFWNINPMPRPFADLRSITGGAESFALGHDPLYENPRDPWNRLMNYPRIWQASFALGINQSHTQYIGGIIAVLFFSGVLIAFIAVDRVTALILAIVIFSPAVLLGIERGNIDLFMFFLLALALLAGRFNTVAALAFILLATILKIFPIFGLSYLLKEEKRRFFLLVLLALALLVAYIVLTFDDLQQIFKATPRQSVISYGLNVGWMWVSDRSYLLGSITRLVSYCLVALVIISALFLRFSKNVSTAMRDNKYIDAFRIGASIYAGTFLLGNNWEYRLMFLIFTIPQLVVWARKENMWLSRLAKVTMVAIVVACWFFMISKVLLFIPVRQSLVMFLDELSTWIVFAGLTHLLIFSMPGWFAWPRRSLSPQGA